MSKKIESIIVEECDAEVWDDETESFVMNIPASYYIINALGQRVFYKTRNRLEAQRQADEDYGKGRYTIRAARDIKTKSKMESGGLSCSGSNSRKGFGSWLKKS